MGSIRITEKGHFCLSRSEWPSFYMNDFSVLGLLVDHGPAAVKALKDAGYGVVENQTGTKVIFSDRSDLNNIFKILRVHQIGHSLTDLVGQAYQG